MSNPNGVPNVTNTTNYPTRPCWTLDFQWQGSPHTRSYYVTRRAEAMTLLAVEYPGAAVTGAAFTEVPLEG